MLLLLFLLFPLSDNLITDELSHVGEVSVVADGIMSIQESHLSG